MSTAELMDLVAKFINSFPWFSQCVNKFDSTNIGKNYDLTELIIKDSNLLKAQKKQFFLMNG